MGRNGSKKRRRSSSARVRALGNVARLSSTKVKPLKPAKAPAAKLGYDLSKFNKILNRQKKREYRREVEARLAEERARKSGATREANYQKAQDERAKVRAERGKK